VCDELESIGYTTRKEKSLTERFQVVNAADFGVPQQRRRIIIIANRLGVERRVEIHPSRSTQNIHAL
jgi:DNA (cytosine-5)-methyltransferase 1